MKTRKKISARLLAIMLVATLLLPSCMECSGGSSRGKTDRCFVQP